MLLNMSSTFVRSYPDPADLPENGLPQVVFLGRSNAGKSTLINSITKTKDLAKTSSTPGKTKLINVFDVLGLFHLVDLPGYGFAKVSKREHQELYALIDGYLSHAPLLKLAILILDSRIGPTKDDHEMIRYLQGLQIPFVLVANKADKLSRSELTQALASLRAEFGDMSVIPHSSVTGLGRGELYDAIITATKTKRS